MSQGNGVGHPGPQTNNAYALSQHSSVLGSGRFIDHLRRVTIEVNDIMATAARKDQKEQRMKLFNFS